MKYPAKFHQIFQEKYLTDFMDQGLEFILENEVADSIYLSFMGAYLKSAIRLDDRVRIKKVEQIFSNEPEIYPFSTLRDIAAFCLDYEKFQIGNKYLHDSLQNWDKYLNRSGFESEKVFRMDFPSYYHSLKHTITEFGVKISETVLQNRNILLNFVRKLDITHQPVNLNFIARGLVYTKNIDVVNDIIVEADIILNSDEFKFKSSFSENLVDLKLEIGIQEKNSKWLVECEKWIDSIEGLNWTDSINEKIKVLDALYKINDNICASKLMNSIVESLLAKYDDEDHQTGAGLSLILYSVLDLGEVCIQYGKEDELGSLIQLIKLGLSKEKEWQKTRARYLLYKLEEINEKDMEKYVSELLKEYEYCLINYSDQNEHDSASELRKIIGNGKSIFRELEAMKRGYYNIIFPSIASTIENKFEDLSSQHEKIIKRFIDQVYDKRSVYKILKLYEGGKEREADDEFKIGSVDLNIEALSPDYWSVSSISEQLQWAKIFCYRLEYDKGYDIFQRYERLIHDKEFRVHIKSRPGLRLSWIDIFTRGLIKDLHHIRILLPAEFGERIDADLIIDEFKYDNPGSVTSRGSGYGNLAKLGVVMMKYGSLDEGLKIHEYVRRRCNPNQIESNCYLQSQIFIELGELQKASLMLHEAFNLHKHISFVGSGIGPKHYFENFLKLNDRETLIEMIEWFFKFGSNSRVASINKNSYDFTEVLYVNEPAKSVDIELFYEIQELYSDNLLTLFDEFATYNSDASSLNEPLYLIQDIIKARKLIEAKEMVKIILHTVQTFILENFPQEELEYFEITDYEDVSLWDRERFYRLVKNSGVQHIPNDANIFDYLNMPDDLGGKRGIAKTKRDNLLKSLNQLAKIIKTLNDRSLDVMFNKLYRFLNEETKISDKIDPETLKSDFNSLDSEQMEYRGTKMMIDGLLPKLKSQGSNVKEIGKQLVKIMGDLSTYGVKRKYY